MTAALATIRSGVGYALPHVGRGVGCLIAGLCVWSVFPQLEKSTESIQGQAKELLGDRFIARLLSEAVDAIALMGPGAGVMTLAGRNVKRLSCLTMTPKATVSLIAIVTAIFVMLSSDNSGSRN